MERRRLLVLANSIKKNGRCVAGRELLSADPPNFGRWYRPISDLPEGELLSRHMPLDRSDRRHSRVRYRAAEALHHSPELVPAFRDELTQLAQADSNAYVRKIAESALDNALP